MLRDCRATHSEPAIASASTIWTRDESSELLRLAIQVGGIGIFDADLKRKRIRFSPELCAILGLLAGTEMDCVDYSQIVDERDRPAVNAVMEAAQTEPDEGAWNATHRIMRPDGTV